MIEERDEMTGLPLEAILMPPPPAGTDDQGRPTPPDLSNWRSVELNENCTYQRAMAVVGLLLQLPHILKVYAVVLSPRAVGSMSGIYLDAHAVAKIAAGSFKHEATVLFETKDQNGNPVRHVQLVNLAQCYSRLINGSDSNPLTRLASVAQSIYAVGSADAGTQAGRIPWSAEEIYCGIPRVAEAQTRAAMELIADTIAVANQPHPKW